MARSWSTALSNMRPKQCEFCEKEYQPTGSTQLWCDHCAPTRFFMVLIRKFGLSKPCFEAILKAQDGRCAICGIAFNPEHKPGEVHKKPYPCVDHDHETGLSRGLLCLRCNTRLGGQGDELRWLRAAQNYVLQHKHILLSVDDPTAQDLLWEYAQRRRAVDAEFSDDLETALRLAGYHSYPDLGARFQDTAKRGATDAVPREQFDFIHRRFDETWVELTKAKATIAALQAQLGAAPAVPSSDATDAELAEVARLDLAATTGPWMTGEHIGEPAALCAANEPNTSLLGLDRDGMAIFCSANRTQSTANAKLTAIARTLMPRLARELPAVKEQLRGAMNRLRLAEEAMQRALADRDRLRQTVGAFIGAVKSEMGGTVSVCQFYPRDGAPHLCVWCGNPKQSHAAGDAR